MRVKEGSVRGQSRMKRRKVEPIVYRRRRVEGRKNPLYVGEVETKGEKDGRKSPLYVGEGETKGEREARKDAHFTRAKAGSCGCRTELVFG